MTSTTNYIIGKQGLEIEGKIVKEYAYMKACIQKPSATSHILNTSEYTNDLGDGLRTMLMMLKNND